MSSSLSFRQAQFTTSAAQISQLLEDEGAEVAFIGRSNAGKSSALNTITDVKGLARTSKTPGRTQLINFFNITPTQRLVDLPGYGFAKAPKSVQQRWEKTTHEYLEIRQSLRGLVLIMDVRHPLKALDQQMVSWATSCGVPLHILLTKSDKLKFGAAKNALLDVQKKLNPYGDAISVQLFSSLNNAGVEDARKKLTQWLMCEA